MADKQREGALNTLVGQVSSTITNSVTTATSATVAKDDMCWLPGGSPERGSRMAACSMYKAMAVTPWSAGQFGVPLGVDLDGDQTVHIGNRATDDLRVVQIEAQTISQTENASGKSDEAIQATGGTRCETVQARIADGNTQASYLLWAGEQPGTRVQIGLAALAASLCLGALIIPISFSTVVLSVGMILLIRLAPIFLLIGIHPGFGRGIALKWLELLLGTAIKRIALAAVLAVLVSMYQVILETPMPWLSQVALIIALGIGAVIFRKPLLETLTWSTSAVRVPGWSKPPHRRPRLPGRPSPPRPVPPPVWSGPSG